MEDTTKTSKPSAKLELHELSDQQLSQFELSGELPDRDAPPAKEGAEADTHAEAAAAEPVEQADSTESKPVKGKEATPEVAKPEKAKGQKKSAKERAAEINAEAQAEEQELAKALERRARARDARREAEREEPTTKRAEQDGKQPPASKESDEPTYKQYKAMPDAPKSKDFEDLDDYVAAMGVFIADKRAEATVERMLAAREQQWGNQEAAQRELDRQTDESFARARAEIEADPEIASRIDDRWKAVAMKHPDDPSCSPIEFIKANVALYARKPLAVAAHFATPDGLKELSALCRMPKDRLVRELAYVDARFDSSTSQPDQDEAADERPSRVSKAPAPAPTLGKKPHPGKDPRKAPDSYDGFDDWNLEETRAAVGAAK